MSFFDFLSTAQSPALVRFNAEPLPARHTPVRQCPLLVLDLETTGLNARKDHIVSIGWIPINQSEIHIAQAKHYLIQSPVSVGQSATIHGLLDRDLRKAHALKEVLEELLETYAGYVFVAHHAHIETSFLKQATREHLGGKPKWVFLDTMDIEQSLAQQKGIILANEALHLTACLRRRKLPYGHTHHALEDAYACALLLLAQMHNSHLTLADMKRFSR